MIIATLIAATYARPSHQITVDLPAPWPGINDPGPLTPDVHRLIVTQDGAVWWNGTPVSDADLVAIAQSKVEHAPYASLLFTPDGNAPYGRTLEVLNLLRQAGAIDRCFRFSGIARYARYDDPPSFAWPVPYAREDCSPLPPY